MRGAFHSDPLDGVVEIIASGFALLYPTYLAYALKDLANLWLLYFNILLDSQDIIVVISAPSG